MSFQLSIGQVEQEYDRIRRALERLPGTLGERVHGEGMAAAARVVRNAAKANAPFVDRSGALRRSIRARRRSQKVYTLFPRRGSRRITGAAAQVLAGARGSRSISGDAGDDRDSGARQAYIIEFGRKPGSNYPGAPPYPFLLPAATSTQGEQFRAATTALRKAFIRVSREIISGKARPITLRHLASDEIV